MDIPEFIDTYSDDIIYLKQGRDAILADSSKRVIKKLCDASFCRMFAVIMIGSIENMLQVWRKRDKQSILCSYFSKKARNEERVQNLYDAFQSARINVDREIFEDYLAIKYLRNVIVHAQWNNKEREWIRKRDFSTDTRRLTEEHWKRMHFVNDKMMLYIAIAGRIDHSKNEI